MTQAEDALARAEALLARLEATRAQLEHTQEPGEAIDVLRNEAFVGGRYSTSFLADLRAGPAVLSRA